MNGLIVFATLALLAQIPHHTHAARQGVSRMDKMFECKINKFPLLLIYFHIFKKLNLCYNIFAIH